MRNIKQSNALPYQGIQAKVQNERARFNGAYALVNYEPIKTHEPVNVTIIRARTKHVHYVITRDIASPFNVLGTSLNRE